MVDYKPQTLVQVLGSDPKDNPKLFDKLISQAHLEGYRDRLSSDSMYRKAFREQLRLVKLMVTGLKSHRSIPMRGGPGVTILRPTTAREIPVLAVDLLAQEGRVDLLRPLAVVDLSRVSMYDPIYRELPYIFYDQSQVDVERGITLNRYTLLPLKLELQSNPAFRQAFVARFYQGLSPQARELRATLEGLNLSFHTVLANPFGMQFATLFSSEDRIKAAFELLGQAPCLTHGDQYDLPSLVEHYCALLGHNDRRKEYLQQHHKVVYLEQSDMVKSIYPQNDKYYFPLTLNSEALTETQTTLMFDLLQHIQMGSLADMYTPATYYLEQLWFQGRREEAAQVLNEFVLDPQGITHGHQQQIRHLLPMCYQLEFLQWLLEVAGSNLEVRTALSDYWIWSRPLITQSRLEVLRLLVQVAHGQGVSSFWQAVDDAAKFNEEDIFLMLLEATSDEAVVALVDRKTPARGTLGTTSGQAWFWRTQLPTRYRQHMLARRAAVA